VEETTSPAGRPAGEPSVTHVHEGGTARLRLTGELTEAARRPLVRVLTELLLQNPSLDRVELDVGDVSFMNSAGMGVLVQGQRMAAPRGIALVLVDPPSVVSRPLQLSGLWHRFPVMDAEGDDGEGVGDRAEDTGGVGTAES
jgi:stage II sporulation protein AA (anti-sigma F factor antagonist)